MTYDLLVKGGTVIDPSQGLNAVRDVALSDGKIAAVEENITETLAREVVDATDLIVTPGLIDLHVHAFWGATAYGMEPDIGNISKGVTTALDTGSAGASNFLAFRRYVLERSDTRLFALLNISAMGMIWPRIGELTDIRWADVQETVRVAQENRDFVLGVKARLSRGYAGENDVEALKRTIEAAEAIDGFVMIHVKDTKTPLEEITAMLRPGDVVTHAFHGKSEGVLDNAGRIIDRFREDQQRGVIFDIGHGSGSFSFRVAEKALAQEFFPDNISSDLYNSNVEGPVFDQITTLSKFLWLGIPLYEVIRRSTETTARIMGLEDSLGTLKVGAEGDVTILRLDEGSFTLTDSERVSVEARQKLNHVRTIKSGRIYRPWLK